MSVNRGLGKGLSDLLGERENTGDVIEDEKNSLAAIPIYQIKVGA